MASRDELRIVDNPERRRFEARDGRRLAGWADYDETAELIVFTHTNVDPEWEGQGVGSTLVRTVLDHTREQGMKVLPLCPFVKSWIDRHPDYADLVFHPADGEGAPPSLGVV